MSFEQVLSRFITLAKLDVIEAEKWQWLCSDAVKYYESKQKENINEEECCCSRLSAAAAAMAFYHFTLLNTEQNISSFKAGDVSLGFSNDISKIAYQIWQQAHLSAAKFLNDDNFFFKKVKA